jgi:FlaA1/EpsC-like NDP-sugar epimerase
MNCVVRRTSPRSRTLGGGVISAQDGSILVAGATGGVGKLTCSELLRCSHSGLRALRKLDIFPCV